MIDNYAKTMELIEKMEAHLPIPAYAGRPLVRLMGEQGVKIKLKQKLQIEHVHYLGDEGGISCGVTGLIQEENTIIVISITHIRIRDSHPLAKQIRVYQLERTRRLSQLNRRIKPTQFTITPHRKSKR